MTSKSEKEDKHELDSGCFERSFLPMLQQEFAMAGFKKLPPQLPREFASFQ